MAKKPTKIEVVQEGDERFLLKNFAAGTEERKPIVKLPKKPPRIPYWKVTFDKSRKKGFEDRQKTPKLPTCDVIREPLGKTAYHLFRFSRNNAAKYDFHSPNTSQERVVNIRAGYDIAF